MNHPFPAQVYAARFALDDALLGGFDGSGFGALQALFVDVFADDGVDDLIVFDTDLQKFVALESLPTGGDPAYAYRSGAASVLAAYETSRTAAAAAVDVDGDGDADLVVASPDGRCGLRRGLLRRLPRGIVLPERRDGVRRLPRGVRFGRRVRRLYAVRRRDLRRRGDAELPRLRGGDLLAHGRGELRRLRRRLRVFRRGARVHAVRGGALRDRRRVRLRRLPRGVVLPGRRGGVRALRGRPRVGRGRGELRRLPRGLVPLACVADVSFVRELLLTCNFPLGVIGALWLGYFAFVRGNKALPLEKRLRIRALVTQIALVGSYLVYPAVSSKVFRALRPCLELDEKYGGSRTWFRDDFSLPCDSSKYEFMRAFAVLKEKCKPLQKGLLLEH